MNIAEKITFSETPLKNNNLGIEYRFEYWGAQKLIDLTQKYNEKLEIKFDTQIINYFHKASTTNGICGFVSGNDL